VIEIQPAAKPLYFAGVQFGSQLLLPYIAGGVESLRAAGFSRLEATELALALGTRALRSYAKGGQKAWNATKTRQWSSAAGRGAEEFMRRDSRLAALYESGVDRARAYFEPSWRKPPEARAKPAQRAQAR